MSDKELHTIAPDVIARLKSAAGAGGWIADAVEAEPFLTDERDFYHGRAAIVLRPATTEAVAGIVKVCSEAGIGIVPQGGNTGYCGGSVPDGSGDQVLLLLSRLNRVRGIDALNLTMTVEAGCVLADIQKAADDAGLLFPLSLGAEGSCQIGGNLSTNAGGVQVLRYGNARDLVLGLEAVLPDGRVFEGLRGLRKDNTGYDLKQLFLGAEGTLGIITAAVLKLFPKPAETVTAMVAIPDAMRATALLARVRAATGDGVTMFEYLDRNCMDLVLAHIEDTRDPFSEPHPAYALIELAAGLAEGGLRATAEATLADAFEAGEALDAVIAESGPQADALRQLRETIPEAQKRGGGSIKHDVSVPVSRIPEFIDAATAKSSELVPEGMVIAFGHIGDGNIHFNLSPRDAADPAPFLARGDAIVPAVHEIAVGLGGSFSAEHGIGQLKKPEMARYKSAVELDLMATVKRTLDPKGIMNPGKVI